jgi:hypothetical protein
LATLAGPLQSRHFDSNVDSNAGGPWRILANAGELLILAVNFKMNLGEPWRTLANDGRRELQNRWSASLAMSTDGSFPSRPRQFRIWRVTAEPSLGYWQESGGLASSPFDGLSDGVSARRGTINS